MSDKYFYLEQGDRVPDHNVMLVLRFAKMDDNTVRVQCQTTNELNAWSTILSLYEDGKIIVPKDLPHGLWEGDSENP